MSQGVEVRRHPSVDVIEVSHSIVLLGISKQLTEYKLNQSTNLLKRTLKRIACLEIFFF